MHFPGSMQNAYKLRVGISIELCLRILLVIITIYIYRNSAKIRQQFSTVWRALHSTSLAESVKFR
jgi:hypothetical protein